MSWRTRTARARVYTALVACLLWLVGIEALPALHQATHDRIGAHRHEGALIIPIDAYGRDAGEAREDLAAAPTRHAPNDGRTHATGPLDHGHGGGGLAHRELAIAVPAIPVHAPIPVDRRPRAAAIAIAATPISVALPEAAARGPPGVES